MYSLILVCLIVQRTSTAQVHPPPPPLWAVKLLLPLRRREQVPPQPPLRAPLLRLLPAVEGLLVSSPPNSV